MTWPVTQRFVFSQSTEQTVPSAKANSPLNAPVLLMVFSVGLFTEPFSCSSVVYSVLGFLGAGRFFSGYLFRTGRMILAVAIMNECKLRLSPLFFPHPFQG